MLDKWFAEASLVSEFGALAAAALAAAVLVAGLTVIAASPRIRPELIRSE